MPVLAQIVALIALAGRLATSTRALVRLAGEATAALSHATARLPWLLASVARHAFGRETTCDDAICARTTALPAVFVPAAQATHRAAEGVLDVCRRRKRLHLDVV
jgi:hypothetical protein